MSVGRLCWRYVVCCAGQRATFPSEGLAPIPPNYEGSATAVGVKDDGEGAGEALGEEGNVQG
eukprot:13692225-Alexandrium_andersonii.AAC.1